MDNYEIKTQVRQGFKPVLGAVYNNEQMDEAIQLARADERAKCLSDDFYTNTIKDAQKEAKLATAKEIFAEMEKDDDIVYVFGDQKDWLALKNKYGVI